MMEPAQINEDSRNDCIHHTTIHVIDSNLIFKIEIHGIEGKFKNPVTMLFDEYHAVKLLASLGFDEENVTNFDSLFQPLKYTDVWEVVALSKKMEGINESKNTKMHTEVALNDSKEVDSVVNNNLIEQDVDEHFIVNVEFDGDSDDENSLSNTNCDEKLNEMKSARYTQTKLPNDNSETVTKGKRNKGNSEESRFSCPFCEYVTKFARHYAKHSSSCKKQTITGTKHMRKLLHKTSVKSRECVAKREYCGSPKNNASTSLIGHPKNENNRDIITISHTSKQKSTRICPYCGKISKDSREHGDHLRVHTKERPFECETCPKKFTTKSALSRHSFLHSGVKRFLCTHCPYTSTQSTHLKSHMVIHTQEKTILCEFCDYKTGRMGNFKKHVKSMHTGPRVKRRKCICDYCGKELSDSYHLKEHVKLHEGDLNFKCTECGKEFVNSIDLSRHSWKHKDRKRFQCSECDYSCVRADVLKRHVLVRHRSKKV